MVRNTVYLILLVAMLSFFGSCRNDKRIGPIQGTNTGDTTAKFSGEIIEEFIDNMSSPVEMANLVKELKVPFSNKYIAPTDNVEDFSTNFQQAFNLGIYGADLGYLNMYNKTNNVLDYIGAIKILSDEINVGQFFDFKTLKRLAQSNSNLDSLMYISVHSFNQMDSYLRQNERDNLSILIVTGVWLEGMYLVTQVYKDNPNPELKEKIGEQKIILPKLIIFLNTFKKDKQFEALSAEFGKLQQELDSVEITIKPGEPEMIEKDGMLTFIQNDVSIVDISDETVQNLIIKTEQIRNKLISK